VIFSVEEYYIIIYTYSWDVSLFINVIYYLFLAFEIVFYSFFSLFPPAADEVEMFEYST